MKKKYILLALSLFSGVSLFAQVKYKYLNQGFGTSIMSINSNGKGITGGYYYDFETHTLTKAESNVGALSSINDNSEIAGSLFIDPIAYTFQPGYYKKSEWKDIPWFDESNPADSKFTVYKISNNSKWVVGQMSISEKKYGMFIYDTETKEMKRIISSDYEAYSAYNINDNGIIVGWADAPQQGTQRIPVWVDINDMKIHEIGDINKILNAANGINNKNIIVGGINGSPFLYDLNNKELKVLNLPEGAIDGELLNIAENNIAIGYARIDATTREAIIYHPDLGDTPIYLNDWLKEKGITINTTDQRLGTANTISFDGNYIGGYVNSTMPAFSYGWVIYMNNEFLTLNTNDINQKAKVSIYPNPATDYIHFLGKTTIVDINIYDLSGKLIRNFQNSVNNQINISDLPKGNYILKYSSNNKQFSEKIIKK